MGLNGGASVAASSCHGISEQESAKGLPGANVPANGRWNGPIEIFPLWCLRGSCSLPSKVAMHGCDQVFHNPVRIAEKGMRLLRTRARLISWIERLDREAGSRGWIERNGSVEQQLSPSCRCILSAGRTCRTRGRQTGLVATPGWFRSQGCWGSGGCRGCGDRRRWLRSGGWANLSTRNLTSAGFRSSGS